LWIRKFNITGGRILLCPGKEEEWYAKFSRKKAWPVLAPMFVIPITNARKREGWKGVPFLEGKRKKRLYIGKDPV